MSKIPHFSSTDRAGPHSIRHPLEWHVRLWPRCSPCFCFLAPKQQRTQRKTRKRVKEASPFGAVQVLINSFCRPSINRSGESVPVGRPLVTPDIPRIRLGAGLLAHLQDARSRYLSPFETGCGAPAMSFHHDVLVTRSREPANVICPGNYPARSDETVETGTMQQLWPMPCPHLNVSPSPASPDPFLPLLLPLSNDIRHCQLSNNTLSQNHPQSRKVGS